MPIPPQFLKAKGAADTKPAVSVHDALACIGSHVSSPRAKAALNTLRSELDGGPSTAKPGSTTDAKAQALARMKG